MSITRDTTIVACITSDVSQTLTATVLLGEAARVTLVPESAYPEGPVVVPYTVTNTGSLPLSFDTVITLRTGPGTALATPSIRASLPPGESQTGTLRFDRLLAGAYTLDYSSPSEAGSVAFRVIVPDPPRLTALAGPADAATIPVTVTVSNPGFQPFEGQVTLRTDFGLDSAPVGSLTSGTSVTLVLPVDVTAATAGDHAVHISLSDLDGALVDQATVTLTVPAAQLVVTGLPTNLTLPVSTTVTLVFTVTNLGGAAGEGSLVHDQATFSVTVRCGSCLQPKRAQTRSASAWAVSREASSTMSRLP